MRAGRCLKWPNDVLLDGAKVAGVLVEVRTVAGRRATVIGIGLNVNASPPAERVDAARDRPGRPSAARWNAWKCSVRSSAASIGG